jgi:hypothetical protein
VGKEIHSKMERMKDRMIPKKSGDTTGKERRQSPSDRSTGNSEKGMPLISAM